VTERELTRKANWPLAIIRHAQEVTGNVAFTCRYYGVPRQSYYKWLRRYEELGVDGLRDRSCRPLVSPHATKAATTGPSSSLPSTARSSVPIASTMRKSAVPEMVSCHQQAAGPPVQWPRWLTGDDAPVPGV